MRARKKAPAFRRKSTDLHNRKSHKERVQQKLLAQSDSIRAIVQQYQVAFDQAVDADSDELRAAIAIEQVLAALGDSEFAPALQLVRDGFLHTLDPALSVREQTTSWLVFMLTEFQHLPPPDNQETAVRAIGRYRLASNNRLLDEHDFSKLLRSLEETSHLHNNDLQEALDTYVRRGLIIPA